MSKRLKSVAVAVALSLVCFPLAACNSAIPVETDGLKIAGGNSSAAESVGVDLPNADQTEPDEPGLPAEPTPDEPTEPVTPEPEPEPDFVATNDGWSEVYDNAYLWDGDLVKAGWADTAENKAKRPDSYVINETTKIISIGNASAFAYFAHQSILAENNGFEGYKVLLENDIDLGGDNNTWIPISFLSRADINGDAVNMFRGVFDGQGKTIYNFSSKGFYDKINYTDDGFTVRIGSGAESFDIPFPVKGDEYVYGLFGSVGNAEFKNLTVADVRIDMAKKQVGGKTIFTDAVGGLVGYAAGDLIVTDCVAGAEKGMTDPDVRAKNYIKNVVTGGGLVGRAYTGKKNGNPLGSVGDSAMTDGVIKEGITLGSITVKNCVNYLDIELDGENVKSGGIIGTVSSVKNLLIEDCENYGDLAGSYVGGALSFLQGGKWLTDSDGNNIDHSVAIRGFKNHGAIYGAKSDNGAVYAAGVVGQIINFTHSYGDLKDRYEGKAEFDITDCFNYGNVYVDQSQTYSTSRVGGISANITLYAKNGRIKFEDNFNYGDIAGYTQANGSKTGGLIGALNVNYTDKKLTTLSGGNCGMVTGGGSNVSGCVTDVTADSDVYTVKYLINAYNPKN